MDKKYEGIELEMLNKIYRDMAQLIGVENTIKIYQNYKGLQINFPTRIYSKEHVINEVIKEYNKGGDISPLAVKYDYSERWMREVISAYNEKNNDDGK